MGASSVERAALAVRGFSQLTKEDVEVAGGKGANLGELTHAGLPVPPGFVVNLDVVDSTRRLIAAAETRLILDSARATVEAER